MPTRKKAQISQGVLKNMADNISHKFHQLEESLGRIDRDKRPTIDIAKDLKGIHKDFVELEKESGRESPASAEKIRELSKRIIDIENAITEISTEKELTLDVAQKITGEIKEAAGSIPEIAELLNIPVTSLARAPEPLQKLVTVKETSFKTVSRTQKQSTMGSSGRGPVPIDVSFENNDFVIKERPHIDKIRIKANVLESSETASHLPLMVVGVRKNGKETQIGSGLTNQTGYLSLSARQHDLSLFERVELRTRGNGVKMAFDKADLVDRIFDSPIIFDIPFNVAREIKEKPMDFIAIDEPDAEDLAHDPDSFSFDAHAHEGSACIKARPEIAVRNFNFSQLVRAEESDLIEQNSDDSTIREREPVTAPVPVRPNNNIGANLSVVGGRIITGKIINYRQSWQPAAQGLGKLLYSLALAPREEIKIAVIDWRRSERATRQDNIRLGESFNAELNRDTTVSDIVTGTIEENVVGGSDAETSTEANNKPGWGAYLGGALVGGLLGGPIGAGLGIAAVHYIRPDTGADSEASNTSWNNAVRHISAQTVHQASDVITQRASAIRDLRSTVVTTSQVSEQENVRTRTVRNQNQHHALTIQYYQVLAHYRVVTEAQSEDDVLMVPYAIDHDVFASLPTYTKFMQNPRNHTISRFFLRHNGALRNVLPVNLRRGMDAFSRLVYHRDHYNDPQVTASRWTLLSSKAIEPGIDVFLDTEFGLLPLRPLDSARTQFSSNQVALEQVRGIHFRLNWQKYVEENMPSNMRVAGFIPEQILDRLMEMRLDNVSFSYSDIQLTAQLTRGRHLRANQTVFTLDSHGSIELSESNRSDTLRLNTPSSNAMRSLLGVTPTEADYQAVEAVVTWLQQNPMTVMGAIWMSEDANERALRFDRLSYNGHSLLNIIENRPLGVDGNYVAFRLAPNLRVLPPIDLSLIGRQSRVVSVPTSGVFAETYLSCHNATEKRDITREIDQSKAVPFGAPDIAPIATGTRGAAQVPQPMSLPSPVVNFQSAPELPRTAIAEAVQGMTAASPFPNLSFGAETMETIRTLADTAMKVDGEKQKQILETITELSKVAADAAMAAGQAMMGIPPTGAGLSSGSNASGSGGSISGGSSGGGARSQGAIGAASSSGTATPQHRAQVGQQVRASDPATNYDHIKVVEEAERAGKITAKQAASAVENIVGATGEYQSSEVTKKSLGIITHDLLRQIYPSARVTVSRLKAIAAELTENLTLGQLDSELRLAHFLAQLRYETGPNLTMVESLNYAVDRLSIFSFYREHPELAEQHGRNDATGQAADQEAIANHAYAGRIGNGDAARGDGWKFRGRGLIQLTGRGNYESFKENHEQLWNESIDFVAEPDLVAQEKYAVRSAIEFWLRNRLYLLADAGDSYEASNRVTNGINPGTDEGSREARYNNLRMIIDNQTFRGIV